MTEKKFWDHYASWEEAAKAWDTRAKSFAQSTPLNEPKNLPKMVGITKETAKNLKWKSLKYMIAHDKTGKIKQNLFKHPVRYGKAFIQSAIKKQPFEKQEDFFLYGVSSVEEFEQLICDPNSIFVLGFSYCHKPHECPSGRFTDQCIKDKENPVCGQCFIGKSFHALSNKNTVPLVITTIHYIGEKMFDVVNQYPNRSIYFLISACELCLKMFADWGNMVGAKGLGIRLDGRICNTMKAFEFSEVGIKPGLTVILEPTKQQVLKLIRTRRESVV